jgi:hypothetical protein
MLAEAEETMAAGDTLEAERRAKAVSALVKAARDVADLEAFARSQPPEEDEEAIRAEIRSRIARFIEADIAGAPHDVMERLGREAFEE